MGGSSVYTYISSALSRFPYLLSGIASSVYYSRRYQRYPRSVRQVITMQKALTGDCLSIFLAFVLPRFLMLPLTTLGGSIASTWVEGTFRVFR